MANAHRKALERLWKDRCSIFVEEKVTDPTAHLTGFEERPLFQDQPCKLSFETLASSSGDPMAAVTRTVELSLSLDVETPAGCKIVVIRFSNPGRKFTYSKSGEAGVFANHQGIQLEPWEGYA